MKRLLALLTVAVLLVTFLSSCNSNAMLIDSKTLKIGLDNTYPPMEYSDGKGNTIGFDIDMAKEIGKRLELKVELIPTAWKGIFSALDSRKYDCVISSISMTADRVKHYTFSKAYVANSQMIVVRPGDSSITKPEDLKGKRVGCQLETTANVSADKLQAKGTRFKELKTYDEINMPFADLKAGRIDAIIVDEVVGQYYIVKDKANYMAAAVKLTNEPIGVCFKLSNTALRDKVQKAIDDMVADGTMKKLSIQWFGLDLTSNIDTVLK